ncbi:hypothetical protein G6F40_016224 [Rhizopus arrhizus]|nr:hypothetical protein G6F40_016224 [Rhizopus arrhizus]
MLGALGGLHAERGIAAGAAAAGHVVLALDLFRQGEEGLEGIVGRVDVGLRDAMVADARESPLAVGRAQLGHEGLAGAVETGDVEGGDLAHSGSWLVVGSGGPAHSWPA